MTVEHIIQLSKDQWLDWHDRYPGEEADGLFEGDTVIGYFDHKDNRVIVRSEGRPDWLRGRLEAIKRAVRG